MAEPNTSGDLVVVPANEASWEDLQAVLGERGIGAECPIMVPPGTLMTWGEEFVGFPQVFAAAGFTEVSRPAVRRVVMRVDFKPVGCGGS